MKVNFPLVAFEVLTAVTTKSTIFWVLTPSSLLAVHGRFDVTYRIYLSRLRICLLLFLA
jgi:hypothetical protein